MLNLVQNRDDAADPDAEKIEELIAQRAAAKKEKNFAEADRIRGVLADMGVTIKDTRQYAVEPQLNCESRLFDRESPLFVCEWGTFFVLPAPAGHPADAIRMCRSTGTKERC